MAFPPTGVAWTRPVQPPAYNAVNARTSLHPAPATVGRLLRTKPSGHADSALQPVVTASPSKAKKVEWPPAVREYVRRAFEPANAIPGISNADMQEKLKETISFYAERDAHVSIDWPNHPLPQELLRDERAQQLSQGFANSLHLDLSPGQTNPKSPQTKKRKSQDAEELQPVASTTSIPPWRKSNLESRITFAEGHNDKRQKKNGLADVPSKFDQTELEKRRQRFNLPNKASKAVPPWGHTRKDDQDEMSAGPVVGTNEDLEKPYLRLTAPPKASTVRPPHILEQTLAMLTKKWKAEKNYNYICNQFKSLRQDLTVQHVKNAFTVKVYEIHARISLEKGDLGEYNQCQTQLKALYAQNLGGNPAEFTAYRILYFVYTCNKTDMNDMLAELTLTDKSQKWIKHALDVRSSLALGNYHKFFRLYLEAQNMGGYLMDMFIERERLSALANISRGYMHVTLRFLTDELGFENDETCRDFLESHGAQTMIETKDGVLRVKLREAASHFEGLRAAAFRKVDIKGQI